MVFSAAEGFDRFSFRNLVIEIIGIGFCELDQLNQGFPGIACSQTRGVTTEAWMTFAEPREEGLEEVELDAMLEEDELGVEEAYAEAGTNGKPEEGENLYRRQERPEAELPTNSDKEFA